MTVRGRTVEVNGIRLNVVDLGAGPALVLLHGFPDSHALWRDVIPGLLQSGCRVIAPDLRGFGDSDAPRGRRSYGIDLIVADVVALLDELGIERSHLVGHDWGSAIGWVLAGRHPERFETFTAISVGHPRAYARAGWEQKRKGWYTLFFQLPWLPERLISANGFRPFRRWLRGYPETDRWISDLRRPGRLTAALNWYRANILPMAFRRFERCRVPVMGLWSTRDVALAESQMTGSAEYVDGPWRYERFEDLSHWIPLEAPERLSRLLLEFVAAREAG